MSKVPLSREDAKPSEWLIFGYWCTTIYRSFKSLRETKQERVEENEKPAEEPQEYWLTSIYHSLQSRKEKPAEIHQRDHADERKAQTEYMRIMLARSKERWERYERGRRSLIPEDQKSGEVKVTEETVSETLSTHTIHFLQFLFWGCAQRDKTSSYTLPASNTQNLITDPDREPES